MSRRSVEEADILGTLIVTKGPAGTVCPECNNTQLVKSYLDDVELDYCPSCTGIFFDAGELEKTHPEYKNADIDEIKSDARKGITALVVIGTVIRIIAKIASRD